MGTVRARPGRSACGRVLDRDFYLRDAVVVARELLGCLLVSRHAPGPSGGRIVETEAYLGPEDAASHAAFRPGSRALFYGPGGVAYVFRAYGVHLCLNAITGAAGDPGCVLIRAIEPCLGLDVMAARRGVAADSPRLASGPGNVTRALGLDLGDNGADLTRGLLTIAEADPGRPLSIATGPRIGITRAVALPLRFSVSGNRHVSAGATRRGGQRR